MSKFGAWIKHAWNSFTDVNTDNVGYYGGGGSISTYRPDQRRVRFGVDRTIIPSIYTRIAIDTTSIGLRHVKVDEDDNYLMDMKSGLQRCLTLEANIDQSAKQLMMDIVMSMLEDGVTVVVPVDTDENPNVVGSYDIKSMRVGKVIDWYPRRVRVKLYNDRNGRHEDLILDKEIVSIIENPMFPVMNQQNSTLQRLIRKLSQLDAIDDQSSSGKLDLIIQLPYVVKSEARREQAEQRRKDIEVQLSGSKYGIAYTDGTEKITQLNRPAENNMMKQIEYLTAMLYGQLGLTEEIMNGTADEATMINYYNRTIEPILSIIAQEFMRKFLTKTGVTQGQAIKFFRDPFKLVPLGVIAEIADKFTRNEILTSNEIRGKIGVRPSKDPKANMLINSNMPQPNGTQQAPAPPEPGSPQNQEGDSQNGT